MAQGTRGSNNLVFIFVGAAIALAAIVLVFRLVLHNPCPELIISMSTDEWKDGNVEIRDGDVVTFYDSLSNSENREWIFDGGALTLNERRVKNIFRQGTHTVTLVVDKKCRVTKQFTVLPAPVDTTIREVIPETPPLAKAEITGPTIAYVGEWANFKGIAEGATEWQWQFSETGKIDSRKQNPSYKFKTTGRKLVTMTINGGNSEVANFVVTVKEREKKSTTATKSGTKTVQEPVKYFPSISEKDFETYLFQVLNGSMTCADFNKYFCESATSTTVTSSLGEQAFSSYCSKLKNKSGNPPTHITVEFKKDNRTNCIKELKITQR